MREYQSEVQKKLVECTPHTSTWCARTATGSRAARRSQRTKLCCLLRQVNCKAMKRQHDHEILHRKSKSRVPIFDVLCSSPPTDWRWRQYASDAAPDGLGDEAHDAVEHGGQEAGLAAGRHKEAASPPRPRAFGPCTRPDMSLNLRPCRPGQEGSGKESGCHGSKRGLLHKLAAPQM